MSNGMRVLLQDRNSLRYFKWGQEWVLDSRMATDFSSTSRALHSAAGHRHLPLDIVLKFNDSRYDLRISIPQRPG
ncbi:MAG TPA: hypothetical protein VFC07_03830 [Verrucomicrobiae bacterium]|nr:hypothetical protein [Verrucomicrobiae bacterium]